MILTVQLDTEKAQDRATLNLLLQANVATQQKAQQPQVAPVPKQEAPPIEQPEQQSPLEENAPEVDAGGTPEVDADGAEWNAELHASTKTKTQDGLWTKRRQRKGTPKAVEALRNETNEEPPAGQVYSLVDLKEAVTKHVGQWGIDRTKQILLENTGSDHPGTIPPGKVSVAIEALKNDKGGKSETIDMSDFC